MHKSTTEKYFKSAVIRRYRKVVAFAVFGLASGVFLTLLSQNYYQPEETQVVELPQTESGQVVPIQEGLPASNPVRLRIPSIGVDTVFEEPLGIQENSEIEVPKSFETVAYYKYGPTPGELGPSVVLGHVDSFEGPAVFYSLGQVKIGELIEIDREDGTTARFVVESMERPKQSDFPTKRVYGNIAYPGLRLITCTGVYDKGKLRYTNNLIVYARLVEDTEEGIQKEIQDS